MNTLPEGFEIEPSSAVPEGFEIEEVNSATPPIAAQGADQQTGNAAQGLSDAVQTMNDISSVYPAIETSLNFLTSTYGLPISGLAGLGALFATGDLSKADKAIKALQDALIYLPKTEGGARLTESIGWPFKKLDQGAEYVGTSIADAGFPMTGAGVKSAIVSAPVLLGAKNILSNPSKAATNITLEIENAVKSGVTKALKPSSVGKKTRKQLKSYHSKAKSAVIDIIKNKDNLHLVDETGKAATGLPKTLDQFSQAIEQTKTQIFKEYDSLAQASDMFRTKRPSVYPIDKYPKSAYWKAVKIDLEKTAMKLDKIIDDNILNDLSPETVKYAQGRKESLLERQVTGTRAEKGGYTAVETQQAIQLLNQSLEAYYRDPTPAMKGKALVDSLLANNLRKQLDAAIKETTGKDYQGLKNRYANLKAIEADVMRRNLADARKSDKSLTDFSDVLSGHQVVKGVLRKDPVTIAAGVSAKSIARYYRYLNDPNKKVQALFSKVDGLLNKNPSNVSTMNLGEALMRRYQSGEFNQQQISAYDELKRRGVL